MPDTPQKFYLTTPIYYVNARPHIGHAYSTIAADVIARRHRLLGNDTFFLTGTDEHGQKVQRSAEKAGIPPQQFADEVSATFRDLWKRMGLTNDDYIRTTDERHKRGVQKLWRTLEERGAIYLSSYTGQYSVGEEMFIDGPPGTIGPDGKPTETVTEENYFFRLSDYQQPIIDLIESNQLHIQPDAIRNEVLSFLRGPVGSVMHEVVDKMAGPIDMNVAEQSALSDGTICESATGEFYVPGALKDLSISRTTFDWGVKVPGNDKHVVYVWLDALANYMTAIGYGAEDRTDLTDEQKQAELDKFAKYWPADLHLVGKEITRFHCVYWPAFLMAAGLKLPKSVVANGWLLFEESKMSKSRGNVVRTETILDAFGPLCPPCLSSRSEAEGSASPEVQRPPTKAQQDLFASDIIRYFLLREIPFGQDGSFSFDALITRYNADLVNGYANLAWRVLPQIEKHFGGLIPEPQESTSQRTEHLAAISREIIDNFEHRISHYNFSVGLEVLWKFISEADSYLNFETPWKTASALNHALFPNLSKEQMKDPSWQSLFPWNRKGARKDMQAALAETVNQKMLEDLRSTLYPAAESIRIITALLYPIMPYATASVWAQLGLGDIEEAARNGELKNLQWGGLKPGTKLGPLAPIFPRADKGLAQIMIEMESPATEAPESAQPEAASTLAPTSEKSVQSVSSVSSSPPEAPPTPISIDDFIKVDLRVGQIVVAERIPKADKLLRLEVDLGPTLGRRQILSGIAEHYTPEELLGRRIAVIANLAPRKMRGLESHGMLLAASADDHASKPVLATFSNEVPLGSRIR